MATLVTSEGSARCPRRLDVVVDDAPQSGVVLVDHPRHGLTGMAGTMVMTIASNSSVKPLSGRAHGTLTCLIPQWLQRTRGTRACR